MKHVTSLGVYGNSSWWILALGVGFGANGFPLGHAASILGISMSKKSRSPIDLKLWLRSAKVITLMSLTFVTILIFLKFF